jgi:hypothetical protein
MILMKIKDVIRYSFAIFAKRLDAEPASRGGNRTHY